MDILLAQSANSSNVAAFLPLILMFLIFYFIVIRPQSKQRKEHSNMLNNLKKGDKVLTTGGMYGSISNFEGKNDKIIKLEVSPSNYINIDRNYIASVVHK